MTLDTYFITMGAVFGALVGSFLNVCVGRWPRGESVVAPRSRCPHCGHQIRWFENIPVLSWLALRARCAGCGARISVQYPLVELAVAAIWGLSVWAAGPTLLAARHATFATLLLGVLLTDLQTYTIPDGFTVTGFLAGLGGAFAATLWPPQGPFASFPDAILGACVGAGALAIVGWLAEALLKREAMGFGDVTLMAMIGAHVGPWPSLLTIFLAAAIGFAVTVLVLLPLGLLRRGTSVTIGGAPAPADAALRVGPDAPEPDADTGGSTDDVVPAGPFGLPPIPFGVYLAPGGLAALLFGDRLISWYLAFVGLA